MVISMIYSLRPKIDFLALGFYVYISFGETYTNT
jgi:hypothetical protein